MPISYTVDDTSGLIHEVWTGDVCGSDLAGYWKKYLADPRVLAIRRTLVDLRQATIHFLGPELSELIRTVVVPVLNGRTWTTALVVAKPVQFGVSRQYQVFAEHYSRDAIFHDINEAREWLLRQ